MAEVVRGIIDRAIFRRYRITNSLEITQDPLLKLIRSKRDLHKRLKKQRRVNEAKEIGDFQLNLSTRKFEKMILNLINKLLSAFILKQFQRRLLDVINQTKQSLKYCLRPINKIKENEDLYEKSDLKNKILIFDENFDLAENYECYLENMDLVKRENTNYSEYEIEDFMRADSFYEGLSNINNEIFALLEEEKYDESSDSDDFLLTLDQLHF